MKCEAFHKKTCLLCIVLPGYNAVRDVDFKKCIKTHLVRISVFEVHKGSANNSHILAPFQAAHSDLALLSSVYSRGPFSSPQPPTEKMSEFIDAVPTSLCRNMTVITVWCGGYIRL